MMMKITCLVLVLLSLGTLAGQSCTWAFDMNQTHVSDVQSTNDPNVLLVSILDAAKNERTVSLNIRDQTLEKGSNVTRESFYRQDSFAKYTYHYWFVNTTKGTNGTGIILKTDFSTNIFVKTINKTIYSLKGYLVSEKLQMLYVLATFTSNKEQIRLLTTKLDNTTVVTTWPYIDVIGGWGIVPYNYWTVNEEEQLLFIPATCCYCVNGYYFRYNETTLYHIFTERAVANYNLFDPRSNEFQEVTYAGKVTIHNYELNTVQNFTLDLSEPGTISTITTNTNFPGTLALLGLVTVVIVLVKKRKKMN